MPNDVTDSATGRCFVIEITAAMITAGADEIIIDAGSSPRFVAYDVIVSALKAGGFKITEHGKGT